MSELCIDGRTVGPGRPTFVVAEIGVNHDGDARRAVELVSFAAAAGADAVKLQLFRADRLVHPSASFAAYQSAQVDDKCPADMLRRYELTDDELAEVVSAARSLNVVPLATPFSVEDVDLLEGLGLRAVKIASPDLVNRPLLARAARLGRPVLLSTGAASLQEVQGAVRWLREWGTEFALLHCVSSYPVAAEQANLCWIAELAAKFNAPVGYSDHTTVSAAGAIAAAAGAVIVEKHLTYDRAAPGPDHAASADPQQFAKYVGLIRQVDVLRGTPGKRVLEVERDVRAVSRQSLVLRRPLLKGQAVAEGDLAAQRPGTGIPAAMLGEVVGRRAARALPAGTMLQREMFEEHREVGREATLSHAA